jgi:hypothetical protein
MVGQIQDRVDPTNRSLYVVPIVAAMTSPFAQNPDGMARQWYCVSDDCCRWQEKDVIMFGTCQCHAADQVFRFEYLTPTGHSAASLATVQY